MRLAALVLSPWLATAMFWLAFGACIDTPSSDDPSIARVIVIWDPLACGDPHRIAVELEDQDGYRLSGSAPCNSGSVTIDTAHYGIYYGRVYAWRAGETIRSVTPLRMLVDEPIVRWWIVTPP
jgi:hypothetical protein